MIANVHARLPYKKWIFEEACFSTFNAIMRSALQFEEVDKARLQLGYIKHVN